MDKPRKTTPQVWPRSVQLAMLCIFGATLSAMGIGWKKGIVLIVIASLLATGRP